MTVESIKCPNCGAALVIQPGQSLVTCVYCHSNLRVSPEEAAAALRSAKAHEPDRPAKGNLGTTNAPFRMTVLDVFTIRDRGTVVTGCVESGTLHAGDEIVISRGSKTRRSKVTAVEMFHKMLDQANPGDNVGVLLKDVKNNEVAKGDVLTAAE
jgi:translation elongation factor EF-Tu-like GTPase